MRNLTEEDKKWLARLRIEDNEKYQRKLKILGISDKDIPKCSEKKRTPIYLEGIPYHSFSKSMFKQKTPLNLEPKQIQEERLRRLILVDGDNHVYEGLDGVNDPWFLNSEIIVYCAQEGNKKNLEKKYPKLQIKLVPEGRQAVDKKIKSVMRKEIPVKTKYIGGIFVISHDKGYQAMVEKCKKNFTYGNNRLALCKSISEIRKLKR